MNRTHLLGPFALCLLMLGGCPVKPKTGDCRTSADCAGDGGLGAVCVEGRCQECGADADCRAGFVCRSWKCLPRPECAADGDCAIGKVCRADRCVEAEGGQRECASHADCGEGRICDADGRCVAGGGSADAACAAPETWVVRFGFDEAALGADAQGGLQRAADCLRSQAPGRVSVTGHCDERGTTEYNLALGSRRAEAVRRYLAGLGLSATIDTVTMGKERPLCGEATETCWARNRRAEIMVAR